MLICYQIIQFSAFTQDTRAWILLPIQRRTGQLDWVCTLSFVHTISTLSEHLFPTLQNKTTAGKNIGHLWLFWSFIIYLRAFKNQDINCYSSRKFLNVRKFSTVSTAWKAHVWNSKAAAGASFTVYCQYVFVGELCVGYGVQPEPRGQSSPGQPDRGNLATETKDWWVIKIILQMGLCQKSSMEHRFLGPNDIFTLFRSYHIPLPLPFSTICPFCRPTNPKSNLEDDLHLLYAYFSICRPSFTMTDLVLHRVWLTGEAGAQVLGRRCWHEQLHHSARLWHR